MNPRSRNWAPAECEVCAFPFSDGHHLDGVRGRGEVVITLCPNHHRLAHMVQAKLTAGESEAAVVEWAEGLFSFDGLFLRHGLYLLLGYQDRCEYRQRMASRMDYLRQVLQEKRR